MSQNQQQGARVRVALQTLPDAQEDDAQAQVDTVKIVACPVCRAVYVPTDAQAGQHSLPALEEAFLEICRCCFRCQRPACPQCWNPVHHVCAACSEEARLPFRAPVPSVEGLVFLSPASSPNDQASRFSFACQRNGRFYTPEVAPERVDLPAAAQVPVPAAEESLISEALPALPANSRDRTPASPSFSATSSEIYPSWLQEVLGQKVTAPAIPAQPGEGKPAYPPVEPAVRWSSTSQTSWSPVYPYPQAGPAIPPLAFQASQPQGRPAFPDQPAPMPDPEQQQQSAAPTPPQQETAQEEEEFSVFERIENLLIVITSILLLAVVLMIVLSISFVPVNTFFLNLLHIDIRTEIAYLLQLR